MGLFSTIGNLIKMARSPSEYFAAGMAHMPGYGMNGSKSRPWRYDLGMKQYNSWAFAAANLNAFAVAGVPLRLYTRVRPGTKRKREYRSSKGFDERAWQKDASNGKAMLYETREVDAPTARHLVGKGALQPSEIVRRKAVEFGGDLEEVVEPHPALTILQRVNENWNGHEYTALRMLDLQITGNSFRFYVTGPDALPVSVWRMPPQWTAVIPDPDHQRYILGYSYGYRGNEQVFAEDEVTHFRRPNPDDLYYGKGWFEAAWTAFALHNSRREEDIARRDNYSRPDWLLALKGGGKPEIIQRIRTEVENTLRGTDKRGKFLAIGADVSATSLQFDQPVTDGTDTRVIEEIAAVSGVPIAMLLSNDPTKASSTTARLGWYRETVYSYCKTDEEKENEKHLPRFSPEGDLLLAYDPAAFEDRNEVVKHVIGLVTAGIRTPNQACVELGYPQHDDPQADRLYPPAGNTGGAAAVAGDSGPGQNDEREGGRGSE